MKRLSIALLIIVTIFLVGCNNKEVEEFNPPIIDDVSYSFDSRPTFEDRIYPYVEFFDSIVYDDSEITENFTGNVFVESGRLDRDGENYLLTLTTAKKTVLSENDDFLGEAYDEDLIGSDFVEDSFEEENLDEANGNPSEINISLFGDDVIEIKNAENERFPITVDDFYSKVQRGYVETDSRVERFEYNFEGIGDCIDKNGNFVNAISFEDDKIIINFNKIDE